LQYSSFVLFLSNRLNQLALCIFPFAAKPMIQGFIFQNDEAAYLDFLENRKKQVADFIIKAIKPC